MKILVMHTLLTANPFKELCIYFVIGSTRMGFSKLHKDVERIGLNAYHARMCQPSFFPMHYKNVNEVTLLLPLFFTAYTYRCLPVMTG